MKKIVKCTNFQNAIKASDLASNDRIQVHLEKEFRKRRYRYLRKKMIRADENKAYSDAFDWRIDRGELAQCVAAIVVGPRVVREGIEKLYENEIIYKKIFKENAALEHYLIPYWLHKLVKKHSNQVRSYSIWFTLEYLYRILDKSFDQSKWKKFIELSESRELPDVLEKIPETIFQMLNDGLFKMKEKEAKKEGEDIERSSYFKTERAEKDIERYIKSADSKKYRERIEIYVARANNKITRAMC